MGGRVKGPYGPYVKPITRFRSDGQVASAGSIFEMNDEGSALIFSIRCRRASTRLPGASKRPLNWSEYFQSMEGGEGSTPKSSSAGKVETEGSTLPSCYTPSTSFREGRGGFGGGGVDNRY